MRSVGDEDFILDKKKREKFDAHVRHGRREKAPRATPISFSRPRVPINGEVARQKLGNNPVTLPEWGGIKNSLAKETARLIFVSALHSYQFPKKTG